MLHLARVNGEYSAPGGRGHGTGSERSDRNRTGTVPECNGQLKCRDCAECDDVECAYSRFSLTKVHVYLHTLPGLVSSQIAEVLKSGVKKLYTP